jgi:hypothetical protein
VVQAGAPAALVAAAHEAVRAGHADVLLQACRALKSLAVDGDEIKAALVQAGAPTLVCVRPPARQPARRSPEPPRACALLLLNARCTRCPLPTLCVALPWLLPALASRDCSRGAEPRAESGAETQRSTAAQARRAARAPAAAREGGSGTGCALSRWGVGT